MLDEAKEAGQHGVPIMRDEYPTCTGRKGENFPIGQPAEVTLMSRQDVERRLTAPDSGDDLEVEIGIRLETQCQNCEEQL